MFFFSHLNTWFAWNNETTANFLICWGVIAPNLREYFAPECDMHFKRCLLFENRPVTKQFVVSPKVDKFKLCAHIRLARPPSRLYAVCKRSANWMCLCLLNTNTVCSFVLMKFVYKCARFYVHSDHTRSLCVSHKKFTLNEFVWLRLDVFSM